MDSRWFGIAMTVVIVGFALVACAVGFVLGAALVAWWWL